MRFNSGFKGLISFTVTLRFVIKLHVYWYLKQLSIWR